MSFASSKNRRKADNSKVGSAVRAAGRRFGGSFVYFVGVLLLCAALAVGGRAGYQWATSTPMLAVKKISFSGQRRATEADLLRLGGNVVGQNLLAIDVSALVRAMTAHPWVKRVEISRRLPPALSVEVVEHEPVAIAALGDLYLLNEAGEPFKRLQAQDALDLPLITGLSREEFIERSTETVARLARALTLARAYGASHMAKGERLSEVLIEDNEITLVTGEGQEVRLGPAEADEALDRLARVRAELSRRGLVADIIHLNNRVRPGWVTVKLSTPQSERKVGLVK